MSELQVEFPELEEAKGAELLTVDVRAASGGHDGSRIERDRERVAAILAALHEGLSFRHVAAAFHVSRNTVAALAAKYPEAAEPEKKRLAGLFRGFARLAVERATAEVDKIPAGLLVLNACQAADKALLLMGEATVRVAHKSEVRREDVAGYLAGLPDAGGRALDSELSANGGFSGGFGGVGGGGAALGAAGLPPDRGDLGPAPAASLPAGGGGGGGAVSASGDAG